MKNVAYIAVIAACIVVAVVVFIKRRSGPSGVDAIPDSDMTWVKCVECGKGYEMPLKELLAEVREKSMANPTPMPITRPITCKLCGKDGVYRGFKCEKCGEIFRAGAVPGDLEDRCPKCKYSAREAKAKANRDKMGQ